MDTKLIIGIHFTGNHILFLGTEKGFVEKFGTRSKIVETYPIGTYMLFDNKPLMPALVVTP